MKAKLTIAALSAVTVGVISTGCASHKEETASQQTQPAITESSGAQAQYSGQSEYSSADNVVIPLHEEQLNVSKKNVEAGQVTIHKTVKTETVSQPVELRKEKLMIQREGMTGSSSATAASSSSAPSNQGAAFGSPFEEKTVTIQLQEEQPLIEKTTVESGRVVAKKNVEWEKQNVQQNVRREDISVDKSGNVNVSVEGEAAGAQKRDSSGTETQTAPK